jgi:hypothetical protein
MKSSVLVKGEKLDIELTDALKKDATETTNAFAKAFHKSSKAIGGVSNILLEMGKRAVAAAEGDILKGAAVFDVMCKTGQKAFQEANKDESGEIVPIAKLLPTWSPTKSVILKAMKQETDVRDCETWYEVNESIKAAERNANGGGNKKGDNEPAFELQNDEMVQAISTLTKTAALVKPEHLANAIALINGLAAKLRDWGTVPEAEGKEEKAGRSKAHKGAQQQAA